MSTIKVAVINPGSKVVEVRTVETDLATFKGLVGGWIEGLTLTEEVSAYINEEGKGLGLPKNWFGDAYIRAMLSHSGRTLLPGDYIAGPVVLLGPADAEGYETDVPDAVVAALRSAGMDVEEAVA